MGENSEEKLTYVDGHAIKASLRTACRARRRRHSEPLRSAAAIVAKAASQIEWGMLIADDQLLQTQEIADIGIYDVEHRADCTTARVPFAFDQGSPDFRLGHKTARVHFAIADR